MGYPFCSSSEQGEYACSEDGLDIERCEQKPLVLRNFSIISKFIRVPNINCQDTTNYF
jgi:hypothetical protein